ncbi:MAG: hypothetical protein CVU87_00705 [Firmicutes bacterium HGW-Firmicutes-12]|nr:MAG: hypothetical protein CVU87_00705 [Firmicutes bacterium HGW-Firmicutes-12]
MKKDKKMFFRYVATVVLTISLLTLGLMPVSAATIQIDTIDPILVIDKVSVDPAVAGGDFTLGISVRNIANNPGFDLAFSFKIKDTDSLDPFSLAANQVTTIDQLDGNATRTMFFTFSVAKEAQNKNYDMVVSLTGKNASFQQVVSSGTVLTIPVTYDQTKPVLIINSADISPINPDPSGEFDVHFNLGNLSKTTDARNVVMLLDGADNFEVKEISNKKNIMKLEKGTSTVVSYHLQSKDTRIDNTIKLKISFDYLGSESSSVEEIINLPLSWEEAGIGTTPWVIVNKYTLSDEQILAGNTVALRLFIENTNQRPVKNVKISLGVIKIEETSSTTTTQTTGGTVFSPVNSSNSFYIDNIPGKTVIEKAIDLYVDPNASAKTYIVPVEIKYEDRGGKVLECEELVNIPVTQECKLNVLSLQVPQEGFVGQPVQVLAEFVNVGKVSLGNFMVRLDGEFQKENSTYYVGNLDMGYNDFFQAMLIPEKEGALDGKVVFSYIDNNNKDIEVEHPFSIDIQSMPVAMPGSEGEMGEIGNGINSGKSFNGRVPQSGGFFSSLLSNWLTLLLSLVILVEGFFIWRIRRNRRGEEFLDE